MIKLTGYILVGIGILGTVFFMNYTGDIIRLRALWFAVSLFLTGLGAFLIAWQKFLQKRSFVPPPSDNDAYKLVEHGELVQLTLANSEVKTGSFHAGSFPKPGRIEIPYSSHDHAPDDEAQRNPETYIIHKRSYKGKIYQYISPPLGHDPVEVSLYLDHKGVRLFIDRSDPNKYYFDLPFI